MTPVNITDCVDVAQIIVDQFKEILKMPDKRAVIQ
jgi:hypothetical protein